MDPAKYEYQSEFAKRYFAQGIEQGIEKGVAQGRAAMVLRQLAVRFGPLDDDVQARIRQASIDELDAIGERLLSAGNVYEAVLPPRHER